MLALVADGLTNTEIADRLVISESTARYHLTSLLSKLGAVNRTQAVAHTRQQALLSSCDVRPATARPGWCRPQANLLATLAQEISARTSRLGRAPAGPVMDTEYTKVRDERRER